MAADTDTSDFDSRLEAAANANDFDQYLQIHREQQAALGGRSMINGQPTEQVIGTPQQVAANNPVQTAAPATIQPPDPATVASNREALLTRMAGGKDADDRNADRLGMSAGADRYNQYLAQHNIAPNMISDAQLIVDNKGNRTLVPPTMNQLEAVNHAVAAQQAMESNLRNAAIAAAKAGHHDVYAGLMNQLIMNRQAATGGSRSSEDLRRYYLGGFQQSSPYQNFYSTPANTNGFATPAVDANNYRNVGGLA